MSQSDERPPIGLGAPLYGFPLKFACLLLSLSPNEVAVVVPARQAYSHWASVGQPELPMLRKFAGLAAEFGELVAERLRLGEVDVAHGKVVPLGQLRGKRAGQLADDAFPLALRRLVLAHPKAPGQRHLDLILARPPLGLAARAAHHELARRAPAQRDAGDPAFVSCLGAIE